MFLYEDKKSWPGKCPRCRSNIVWSLASSSAGASAHARCSKSIFNSVITNNLRKIEVCDWIGTAVRQKDGSVRIKDSDGTWIR